MSIAIIFLIIFGLSLITLFTILLIRKDIGSISYTTLLAILALFCLAIFSFPRLRVLDLRQLKMTLDKIETIKENIYAKEKDLKQISILLSEIIAFNSSAQNRLTSRKSLILRQSWNRKKIEELFKLLNVPENEKNNVFKYSEMFKLFDNTEDSKEREIIKNKMDKMLKDDCKNNNIF